MYAVVAADQAYEKLGQDPFNDDESDVDGCLCTLGTQKFQRNGSSTKEAKDKEKKKEQSDGMTQTTLRQGSHLSTTNC
jgi:hypothetical protein